MDVSRIWEVKNAKKVLLEASRKEATHRGVDCRIIGLAQSV
jgi:hypothetical protein